MSDASDVVSLGTDIVIPGSGEALGVLQDVMAELDITVGNGSTVHITNDQCDAIARGITSPVIAGVLKQLQTDKQRQTLAAIFVQQFDKLTYVYQTEVQNLSQLRYDLREDNWQEATNQGNGVWDIPSLVAQLKNSQMYADSFYRAAYLMFNNLSQNSDDATIPSRLQALYTWHAQVIAVAAAYLNVTLSPYVTTASAQAAAAVMGISTSGDSNQVNLASASSGSVTVVKKSSWGLLLIIAVIVAIYYGVKK